MVWRFAARLVGLVFVLALTVKPAGSAEAPEPTARMQVQCVTEGLVVALARHWLRRELKYV